MKSNNKPIMKFDRLPIELQRYSFDNKMAFCYHHSVNFISGMSLESTQNKNIIYPWELEVFVSIAILKKEYNDKPLDSKKFNNMIASIRNYQHPQLIDNNNNFLKNFIMVTGLEQFKIQQSLLFKFFRYNYFFQFQNEKIDMQQEFHKNFNTKYIRVLEFSFLFILINMSFKQNNINIIKASLDYLYHKYDDVLRIIKIDRDSYINKQKLKHGNASLYYGFKCISHYPIIEYKNKLYCPLPHIMQISLTESLLTRLTAKNDVLRNAFGKEVLEKYLYYILKKSNIYDNVINEIPYSVHKNNKMLSPDIIIFKDNICVLFDCTAFSPRELLKEFDEASINYSINRCAEKIIQIFSRIKEFDYYKDKVGKDFKKENIFGVIVLLEDNYICREFFYNEASKRLNLKIDSTDYNYLRSNIKVVGLNDIENITFSFRSYIDGLIKNRDNKEKWYDYSINEIIETNKNEKDILENDFLNEFRLTIDNTLFTFFQELSQKNINIFK